MRFTATERRRIREREQLADLCRPKGDNPSFDGSRHYLGDVRRRIRRELDEEINILALALDQVPDIDVAVAGLKFAAKGWRISNR